MNYKYHYVYRITNTITEMHYYGDRSCNCHPTEDIGIKYFSSFTNKYFKQDQRENPQDYKYKIVKIFETCRTDAKQLEVDLHKRFDVKNHPKFINRANQTSSGFDTSGAIPWNKGLSIEEPNAFLGKTHSDEQKEKWSNDRKGTRLGSENTFYGKKHSDETKKKIAKQWEGDTEERRKMLSDKMKPYKCIQIFNNEDKLIYEIENSFKRSCEALNIPYESLRKSFAKNGTKLYQGLKKKKEGDEFFEFVGWYAKKVD